MSQPLVRPMSNRKRAYVLACGAACAALASAPALASASQAGIVRAPLCADGGRSVIEIDFSGGGGRRDDRSHSSCHIACLSERKAPKLKRTG